MMIETDAPVIPVLEGSVELHLNVGQAFQTDAALLARATHLTKMLEELIAERIRLRQADPFDAEGTIRLAIQDCERARKAVRAATYPRFAEEPTEATEAELRAMWGDR